MAHYSFTFCDRLVIANVTVAETEIEGCVSFTLNGSSDDVEIEIRDIFLSGGRGQVVDLPADHPLSAKITAWLMNEHLIDMADEAEAQDADAYADSKREDAA